MVREARPDVAVASDFIVGFPGETAEDFEATADLVRRMRFAGAFVFKYSPRPGTAAERYADDVPIAEKRRRHKELLALVEQIAGEENQRFAGCTVRVFVEELAPRPGAKARAPQAGRLNGASPLPFNPQSAIRDPQLRGRTPCHRIVVFDGPPDAVGTEVDVAIWKAGPLTLFGKLVD
jgi:tRNA-2-methylthio-N6-dimethylallyladenosine synthase